MSNYRRSVDARTGMVWDVPVRIVHWVLVASIVVAYSTHLLGLEYYKYHVISGYTVIVAAVFRVLWGVWGTFHARFLNFVRGPLVTFQYARDMLKNNERHYVGHNPVGALMVLLLLLCMLVQAATGLVTTDDIFNYGPLYEMVDEDISELFGTVHRTLFYWLVAFVCLHVAAVLLHWILKKDNLITPMVTGRKIDRNIVGGVFIGSSKITVALVTLAIVAAVFWGGLSQFGSPIDGY